MDKFIVYGLTDPRTNRVRYIGKSSNGLARPRSHAKRLAYEPGHKSRWIAHLQRLGLTYGIVVLESAVDDVELKALERYWICQARGLGWQLTNHTDGGEGQSGAVFTAEHREKLAASKRGKPRSAETKKAVAAGVRAFYVANPNHPRVARTDAHRAALSRSNTGTTRTAATRANMSAAQARRRKRERASSNGPRLFVNLALRRN